MDEQLLWVIYGGVMALVGQVAMGYFLTSNSHVWVSIRNIFNRPKTDGIPASTYDTLEKIINAAWDKGVKK